MESSAEREQEGIERRESRHEPIRGTRRASRNIIRGLILSTVLPRAQSPSQPRGGWYRMGQFSNLIERSEERRVGKECRSRWSTYHEKKKKKVEKRCL